MRHLDTIYSSNKQKLPLTTKTLYKCPNVLPIFVTECQRAIRIHHQKEVAEVIVENAQDLLVKHGFRQASPPKANHEPPERS